MLGAKALAALWATKSASRLSRALGRGGGTAVGGLVGLRLHAGLGRDLAEGLGRGSVLVTGTNGKTTTAHMLADAVRVAGLAPIANGSGSNLMRGIVGAMAAAARPLGDLAGGKRTLGVFEVDEAALPAAIVALRPRAVVILNLFRDQLDRYGEVEAVAALWRDALAGRAGTLSMVLNADDPGVAALGEDTRHRVVYFGVNDPALDRGSREHAADALTCACGSDYEYGISYFSHFGHWRCPGCGRVRPATQVTAREVELADGRRLAFSMGPRERVTHVRVQVGGLYNVYNALAAAAAALALGLPDDAALAALEGFRPAFGRQESFEVDGRRVEVYLAKNPAGVNQVLATLALDPGRQTALFLLNDRDADGRDVSWIWDADYEVLRDRFEKVVVGGTRAEEMALRLKYAGWDEKALRIEAATGAALDAALALTPPGAPLTVVPTYTAMLAVREILARRSGKKAFWR